MKVANLTKLFIATVVVLVLLLAYMRYIGFSLRTVAIIATVAFFIFNSSYIFIKRHLLTKQGVSQQPTNWTKLIFLTVVGLAGWIALVLEYIRH